MSLLTKQIPIIDMNVKSFAKGLLVTGIAIWVISRALPGFATRIGVMPRPFLPAQQNTLPEPFGLKPWIPSLSGYLPSSMGAARVPAASGPSQEQLGAAIVAASTASALANITGGSGDPTYA